MVWKYENQILYCHLSYMSETKNLFKFINMNTSSKKMKPIIAENVKLKLFQYKEKEKKLWKYIKYEYTNICSKIRGI